MKVDCVPTVGLDPVDVGAAKVIGRLIAQILAVFFLTAFASGFPAGAAFAQSGDRGDGHAENHNWYRKLHEPRTGLSCCNGVAGREGDCRPVRAYFDSETNQWRAFVDGHWEAVPWPAVLDPRLNQDPLHAHACRSRTGIWYCFLQGGAGG